MDLNRVSENQLLRVLTELGVLKQGIVYKFAIPEPRRMVVTDDEYETHITVNDQGMIESIKKEKVLHDPYLLRHVESEDNPHWHFPEIR